MDTIISRHSPSNTFMGQSRNKDGQGESSIPPSNFVGRGYKYVMTFELISWVTENSVSHLLVVHTIARKQSHNTDLSVGCWAPIINDLLGQRFKKLKCFVFDLSAGVSNAVTSGMLTWKQE